MSNFVSTFYQLGIAAALDISGFTLDHGNCGILITSAADDDCRILYANANFIDMVGYTEQELIGKNCRFLQNDDRDQPALADIRRAIKGQTPVTVELRNYRKDGSQFLCGLSIAPFRTQGGQVTHFIGVQTNIDRLKQTPPAVVMTTQFGAIAVDDRGLQQLIATELQQRADSVLMLLEVDEHRQICHQLDSHGSDHLQRTLMQRLYACIGTHDRLVRTANGSFAIMCNTANVTTADQPNEEAKPDTTLTLAERIRQIVHTPIPVDNQILHLTCCIGIAHCPTDAETADRLLDAARLALRWARTTGPNTVGLYSDEIRHAMQYELALQLALHTAIGNGEMQVFYQPQVALSSGNVIGIEALARWFHPVLGEIKPSQFIPLAEETDLIDTIGTWILEQVCRDLVTRREQGLPEISVAVNLSPQQLANPQLADMVGALIAANAIPPGRLIFEITETALSDNNALCLQSLQRLQDMRVGLALDDFGTRASSLNHLKHLRFQKVKIDCAFTRNVVDHANDAAIVKTIISMAHTLGLIVVAEGVETEAQCEFLRHNMCDEIQGFLFSTPLPAAALNALLRDGVTLPAHLREQSKAQRTLLLVDDEINIVAALKRLLRRDEYLILTANSGAEGLAVLKDNPVDVILSDQRMPGMTGVEFLSIAKNKYPETIRLVLSGYTELQSVTDAVNEGAIYKFLTKPWDDAKLRGHIREAFDRKELADVNRRLGRELYATNLKLATANRQLEELVCEKQQQITRDNHSLQIVREALQHVPLPVIAIDDLAMIAFMNDAATQLLHHRGCLLGGDAHEFLPEIADLLLQPAQPIVKQSITLDHQLFYLSASGMGTRSNSSGFLVTLTPIGLPESAR